jgi:ribosomal protein S14
MTVPKFDPRNTGVFPKKTPHTHTGRQDRQCESCGKQTPHDLYEAILGVYGGFSFPFGPNSTKGKVGKRSHWAFCAVCGRPTPLDDAARQILG